MRTRAYRDDNQIRIHFHMLIQHERGQVSRHVKQISFDDDLEFSTYPTDKQHAPGPPPFTPPHRVQTVSKRWQDETHVMDLGIFQGNARVDPNAAQGVLRREGVVLIGGAGGGSSGQSHAHGEGGGAAGGARSKYEWNVDKDAVELQNGIKAGRGAGQENVGDDDRSLLSPYKKVCSCVYVYVCVCVWVWVCVAVCCSVWVWVWVCVAVCCSVLQCVAVCCSVLQCAAVCCSCLNVDQQSTESSSVLMCAAVCCSVLQCVAVYCSLPKSVVC